MEQHEPPPSLWPIGFAVGVVCLLVGLIVSWVAAAVGEGSSAVRSVHDFLAAHT
jgi:hypothetical protein